MVAGKQRTGFDCHTGWEQNRIIKMRGTEMKMKIIFLLLGIVTANVTVASITEGAGTWKGQGLVFGLDGKIAGSYKYTAINTAVGDDELLTHVVVKLPDGTQEEYDQKMKDTSENGFVIESKEGHGGGYCFGDGLCESYLDMGQGHGIAINMIMDGKKRMRILKTDLQDGKAVRFFREKLVKVK